ncbi:hypothetical protein [Selenomonas ruminis]|uniref:Uncharacterized protein n=1 Tax=Selenomonas ruminis TaxID=2593411 RepID=A0A5D6W0G2_9FIRM|nr:hypothetical protein [Selenomonas sp. mPRGC5]TYZ20224.1 hypothetical protein FZ040_12315 [Selenomonas sp. mPRGC5]
MVIQELFEQINQNKRKKLVKFLQERTFPDTKIELIAGDLQGASRKDQGTISLALCCPRLYNNSGRRWDFIVITDKMASKDAEEEFTRLRMDAELVRCMLPQSEAEIKFESDKDDKIRQIGTLSVKVEMLQEQYNSVKEGYELVSGYLDESNKEVLELSAWKSAHSGNYRNAGRPRKFDKFEKGRSIYIMHDKENMPFRKIADLMNMSYSSARRIYLEYRAHIDKYGEIE